MHSIHRVIAVAVIFGICGLLLGLLWSIAIGFNIGIGLLAGGLIGAIMPAIQATYLTKDALNGMTVMYGGIWLFLMIAGGVVWLVRFLIGC